MAELEYGPGGLSAAARAVKPGDTVLLTRGVYRGERLVLTVPNVTWRAAEGTDVWLDGGWGVGAGPGDGQGGPPLIAVGAAGVVLDGIGVRNSPGDGIAVGDGAHESALLNCRVDNSYSGGIIVNGSKPLRKVRIEGCAITRSGMSWEAGYRRNVSGSLNLIRAEECLVVNTTVAYGYGEGINIGKGSARCIVRGCTVFDNAHLCLYFNRSVDCVAEGNVLFLTGFRPRLVGKETWPAGIVFGDEVSARANTFPHSRGNRAVRNVVVNCGTLLSVRNNNKGDGYDTCLDAGTVIEGNTFVGGPCTRAGIDIKENLQGRPHEAACIRGNATHMNFAMPGADIATSSSRAIYWHKNGWSQMPPELCRSDGDVVAFALVAADAPLSNAFPDWGHNLNVANYRPQPNSPLTGRGPNGLTIGALDAAPVEPPPPPPPPNNIEVARERLASARQQLETIAAAGNVVAEALRLLDAEVAIMARAQQDAADNVAAADALLMEQP